MVKIDNNQSSFLITQLFLRGLLKLNYLSNTYMLHPTIENPNSVLANATTCVTAIA